MRNASPYRVQLSLLALLLAVSVASAGGQEEAKQKAPGCIFRRLHVRLTGKFNDRSIRATIFHAFFDNPQFAFYLSFQMRVSCDACWDGHSSRSSVFQL